MTIPTLSRHVIIMPFYGDIDYFKLAVESVRNQSDPEWKLVIIDDQYPDPSAGEWAQGLGDARVHYIRNESNLGVSGNFAKSATLSDAKFTTIMGCDDLLLPNYVKRVKVLIDDHPEAAYFQPGVRVIDRAGARSLPLADRVKAIYRPRTQGPTARQGEQLARSLLRANWSYFPSIVWRTSLLQEFGFRHDLDVVLDLALQLDIVTHGGTMVQDDEEIYAYRRHKGSVSSWTAEDGTRFLEETAYFIESAGIMRRLGWRSAERSARLHLTSRLNELAQVPRALNGGGIRAAWALAAHATRPTPAHSKLPPG